MDAASIFLQLWGRLQNTHRHTHTHQILNLEVVAVDVRGLGVRPGVTPRNLTGFLQPTSGSLSKNHVCTHTKAEITHMQTARKTWDMAVDMNIKCCRIYSSGVHVCELFTWLIIIGKKIGNLSYQPDKMLTMY